MQTEEFANDPRGFFYRAFCLIMCIQMFWEVYMTGFCLMDCSIISSGLGYAPKNEKEPESYIAIYNISIWGCDSALDIS
jgi:hypothetical protein